MKAIAPPNMQMALKDGSIDAFIVAEPFCEKAKMDGVGKILVLSKDVVPNHICCIVVVGKQALKKNPEGVREWVHSLQQNGKFIDHDKADSGSRKTAGIAKKYLPYDEQAIINVMQHPNNRITYSDLTPKVADYRKIHDISVSAGLIQKTDLESFIDGTFSKG
jgi:NitT/TauT family transport system substrate-binding protein